MAPSVLYAQAPAEPERQDVCGEELEERMRGPGGSWRPRGRTLLVLGLAALGIAVMLLGSQPQGVPPAMSANWDETVGLLETGDPCSRYPFISLDGVMHSNLGGQGPDFGDEGIVFQAKDYIPGQAPTDLIVTVNASSTYKAGHARYNGIHGKYGLITLSPGNEAIFTFKVYDAVTRQPKTLAKQEFTFFDLDQDGAGGNREYIKVTDSSQVWLTKNTEIEVTDLPDGSKQFMSSRPGSGADNPKDPLALTVQQKNRAVTLEFENFQELAVTLGCTAGTYARYFMFVIRPSLLCAETVGGTERDQGEVVPVKTTSPAPTTAATTEDPHANCLYVVPVISYCIPQSWKFWPW